MGHKPDQKARKRRAARETKKPLEVDFRAKLRAASNEARTIYDDSLRAIRASKKKSEPMAFVAAEGSEEDRAAATELLNHPRNGFSAYIKPGGESPGGAESGAAPPSIVITW